MCVFFFSFKNYHFTAVKITAVALLNSRVYSVLLFANHVLSPLGVWGAFGKLPCPGLSLVLVRKSLQFIKDSSLSVLRIHNEDGVCSLQYLFTVIYVQKIVRIIL